MRGFLEAVLEGARRARAETDRRATAKKHGIIEVALPTPGRAFDHRSTPLGIRLTQIEKGRSK